MSNSDLTEKAFIENLKNLQSNEELNKIQRYFKTDKDQFNGDDKFIGVKMGQVFDLAKTFSDMPLYEIEKLLENEFHEARVGAVSIMDFKARNKKTSENEKKVLFELYIKRHDRINNWDLVDRSAPYVVGGHLFDKPRDILYELAVSENIWERRTAIVSTYYFIRQNQLNDTFRIAEMLIDDTEDLMHKAAGSWVREAGKKNKQKLISFLDKHVATMPRVFLRNAIEKLDQQERAYYLGIKKQL